MSATVIRVSVNEHVQLCTIERPERRNAFDQEHYVALATAMADAAANDEVHVLVVTGIGASFSAGQDLKEMAALASGTASGPHDGFPRLVDQLDTFPKPLLAAVNGDAVGIGLTMLLHCDIAVVAHDARLRVPFSELGVPPEAGSSALLGDVVGWQQAAELLVLRAATLKEQKQPFTREASMAKLFASEMSNRVCDKAVQIHGGYGYIMDYPIAHLFADHRVAMSLAVASLVAAGETTLHDPGAAAVSYPGFWNDLERLRA